MKAILVVSHGSRFEKTEQEIKNLILQLKEKCSIEIIDYAFLELQHPLIPQGIGNCIQKGATDILVLLNFLNAGRHVDHDIPEIISSLRKLHPQVTITISKPIGQHEKVKEAYADIINLFQ